MFFIVKSSFDRTTIKLHFFLEKRAIFRDFHCKYKKQARSILKSISQVRLENVERLMRSTGLSHKDFSEKSSIAYVQFGQCFGNNLPKNIGDAVARRIETAFELEQFWLDQNW